MSDHRAEEGSSPRNPGEVLLHPTVERHGLREQEVLWKQFLALAGDVVAAFEKSVEVLCEGRFELIDDIEKQEEASDRREVQIEQECLRILARYEPVASDLRRMATVLKLNRDWERIADFAVRIARRAYRLSCHPAQLPVTEPLRKLARDVCSQVRASHSALTRGDSALARAIIAGDAAIDSQYRLLRRTFRDNMLRHANQIDGWLLLLNEARNLERVADHAVGIAQCVIYLQEGIIVRHGLGDESERPGT
jgi:phosphate transport system protein